MCKTGWIRYCAAEAVQTNKALVLMLLCSCALLLSQKADAGTLYVDNQNPSASDSNAGTLAAPWKTIQKAASTAAPGDTVIVKAGVYKEFVTNKVSGTLGKPIVFQGEGNHATIIDPSTDISTGWVQATEFGNGVYKKTGLPFAVREMTIDSKRLAMTAQIGDHPNLGFYSNPSFTQGWQLLTNGASQTVTIGASDRFNTIKFWDGLEALYCSTGSVCYLKLRDGSNPNGRSIRAAPNHSTSPSVTYIDFPAIRIENKSYITYSNFWIRNAFVGVYIEGSNAHHNIIESCNFTAGYCRVLLQGGPYSNIIRSNLLTGNFYGYTNTGAWESSSSKYASTSLRFYNYLTAKFTMGRSTSMEYDIKLDLAGGTNLICGNVIGGSGLGSGINLGGDPLSPVFETTIYGNTVANRPSVGITLSDGQTGTYVYDNFVSDCNSNMRFHNFDSPGETDRTAWIFRNRLYEPDGVGQNIFIHFVDTAVAAFHPTYWVYHNSFSGGGAGFEENGYADDNGGTTNLFFLNNIFSTCPYVYGSTAYKSGVGMIGGFDYNLVNPSVSGVAWFAAHNKTQSTPEWVNSSTMNYGLANGSAAVDAALDVTQPFTLRGRTFPALPVSGDKRAGSAWDIGALELGSGGSSSLAPPSGLRIISNPM